MSDNVNSPAHYVTNGYECIDVMRAIYGDEEVAIFCKLNAFKYLWRCDKKNHVEDIKKAEWYARKYTDIVEGKK